MVGELLGALAEFLAQTINPFARWIRRGREERRERARRQEAGSGTRARS